MTPTPIVTRTVNSMQIGGDDLRFLRRKRVQRPLESEGHVRLVDMFAGCGGLTLGVLEACRHVQLGMNVRLAIEVNPEIASIYRANFGTAIWEGATSVHRWFDRSPGAAMSSVEAATRRAVGPVDLLVGGPPCQGHSPLNNHTRGDDPKNDLYFAMVRATEVLQPRHVIIENVPTLTRDVHGTLERALDRLRRIKYEISTGVVCVVTIGVPQLRKRHVVLASRVLRPNLVNAVNSARVPSPRTLDWAIGDLVAVPPLANFDRPSTLSAANLRRAEHLLLTNEYDLPNSERPACHRNKPDHRYKSMYGRLRWNEPAQTITTGYGSPGQGRYLHPDAPRTLTPHEAARIQFFPDWFDFSGAAKRNTLAEAIGNAVPPKLGFALAAYLLQADIPMRRTSSHHRPIVLDYHVPVPA